MILACYTHNSEQIDIYYCIFKSYIPGMDSEVTFPWNLLEGETDLGLRVGDLDLRGLGLLKVEKSRFSNNLSSLCRTTNSESCCVVASSDLSFHGDLELRLLGDRDRECDMFKSYITSSSEPDSVWNKIQKVENYFVSFYVTCINLKIILDTISMCIVKNVL
jgi:hypothetical protein